nr:PH domain-containing protein [Staphylococcus hominis]
MVSGVTLLIELIILGGGLYCWKAFHWPHFIFYILLVLTICSFIRFILQPINRYSYRFYNIENNNIEILNTFIFKSYKTTKIERLQLLKVKTNPLLKKFNLKRVIVVTAGHELTTPFVSNKEAERLILHILSQMRGSNDDI